MSWIRRLVTLCGSLALVPIGALLLPTSLAQAATAGCADNGPWSREWDDYAVVGLPEGAGAVAPSDASASGAAAADTASLRSAGSLRGARSGPRVPFPSRRRSPRRPSR